MMTEPLRDKIDYLAKRLDEETSSARADIIEYIKQFSDELREFKEETTQAIRVHRDTINNVSNLLSTEFFGFQKKIQEQLEAEQVSRAKRQKFADIKDFFVISVGCLVMLMLLLLLAFVIWLLWVIYVSGAKISYGVL